MNHSEPYRENRGYRAGQRKNGWSDGTLPVGAALVGATGLRYAIDLLLARLAGPAAYGIYASLLSHVQLWGFASTAGRGDAAYRFLPRYQAAGRQDVSAQYIDASLRIAVLTASAAMLPAAAIMAATSKAHIGSIALAALAIVAFTGQTLLRQLLSALSRPLPAALLSAGLASTSTLILYWLFSRLLSAIPALLAATLMGLCLSIVTLVIWIRRLVSAVFLRAPLTERHAWRVSATYVTASNLSTLALGRLDIIVVAWLLGPIEAAPYALAVHLSSVVVLPMQAVSLYHGPTLGRVAAALDWHSTRILWRKSAKQSILLSGIAASLLAAGLPMITRILATGYEGIGTLMLIMAGGRLVSAATGPVALILNAAGRERSAATVAVGVASLHAVSTILSASSGAGAQQIALITGTSIAVQNLAQALLLHRTSAR